MSLLEKAQAIPGTRPSGSPNDWLDRAELAVGILRGKVTLAQGAEALGVRTNGLSGSLWGSLRRAVASGVVDIEWNGPVAMLHAPSSAGPDTETPPAAPPAPLRRSRAKAASGSAPARKSTRRRPAGRVESKAACIREAVRAISGNFTTTEILERVESRWPQERITINHVCATMATMLKANEISAVGKEDRGGSRVMIYRAEIPKSVRTKRSNG